MCQISNHVKEAVRNLGKVRSVEIEKADGGYVSTTRREGGEYPGKKAVHPTAEHVAAHIKRVMK